MLIASQWVGYCNNANSVLETLNNVESVNKYEDLVTDRCEISESNLTNTGGHTHWF